MKRLFATLVIFASILVTMAQDKTPELEFVVELKVKCDGAYPIGETSHGNRFIIPIVGGTFEGPDMKGIVLPGGADYQLQNLENGRTELEAIYSLRTDDGVNIHIRNWGLICTNTDSEGKPQFYFCTVPKFEAPMDSRYAWLNNAIFVCQPSMDAGEEGFICLKVWKVK